MHNACVGRVDIGGVVVLVEYDCYTLYLFESAYIPCVYSNICNPFSPQKYITEFSIKIVVSVNMLILQLLHDNDRNVENVDVI